MNPQFNFSNSDFNKQPNNPPGRGTQPPNNPFGAPPQNQFISPFNNSQAASKPANVFGQPKSVFNRSTAFTQQPSAFSSNTGVAPSAFSAPSFSTQANPFAKQPASAFTAVDSQFSKQKSYPKIVNERSKPNSRSDTNDTDRRRNKDKDKFSRNDRDKNKDKPTRNDRNTRENNSKPANKRDRKPREKKKFSADQFDYPTFNVPPTIPNHAPAVSDDNSILKPLPKALTSFNSNRDDWDVQNQSKLAVMEKSYLEGQLDLQSAYAKMNEMREKERGEMERRGLVDSTEVRKNLSEAIKFIGSCLDMCPVAERIRRANENMALSFEKDGNGRVLPTLAIKAFSRPAAGQPPPLPSDVRPPNVLISTLQYISREILPKLPASHPFVWDRTRSIRQDFTYQNYQGPEALLCFEVIARIHILCLHKMASIQTEGQWSQQQELEQFNKCLQSLSEFYQHQSSENEPEIRAYQLLSQFFDAEMASSVDKLKPSVRDHPLVKLAYELRGLASESVTLFFQRIRKEDIPLNFKIIMEVHYNQLRMNAMRSLVISTMRKARMYPLSRFTQLLGFETHNEAKDFCDYYDVLISSSNLGEEVDVKTWDESNIQDKQVRPQSFDQSLNAQVDQIDVLKDIKFDKIPQPKQPAFNVTASAFVPTSKPFVPATNPLFGTPASNPFAQPSQQSLEDPTDNNAFMPPPAPTPFGTQPAFSTAPSSASNSLENDKKKELEAKFKAQKEKMLKEKEQKEQLAKAQQQELAAAKEKERQKNELAKKQEEEARAKYEQEQIRIAQQKEQERLAKERQDKMRQEQAEAQARAEAQRQREIEAKQKQELYNQIVSTCDSIFEEIAASQITQAVAVSSSARTCLQSAFVDRCIEASQIALTHQIEEKNRNAELSYLTNPRKRVIAQRIGFNPIKQTQSIFTHAQDCGTGNTSVQSMMSVDTPMDEKIDLSQCADEFARAYSLGLRSIGIQCDWNSALGLWLRQNKIPKTVVNIDDQMLIKIRSHLTPPPDIILHDHTLTSGSAYMFSAKLPSTNSADQFISTLSRVLNEYSNKRYNQIAAIKSLAPKRVKTDLIPQPSNEPAPKAREVNEPKAPQKPSGPFADLQPGFRYHRDRVLSGKLQKLVNEVDEL